MPTRAPESESLPEPSQCKRPTRLGDIVMRTGSSNVRFQQHRGRNRLETRLARARKPQLYKIDLEGLESRTLLATIPAATATGAPINLSNLPIGDAGFEYAASPVVAL